MPDFPLYLLQVLLLPNVLCYIYDIACTLFLRLVPAPRADSHNTTGAPRPCSPPPVSAPGGSIAVPQDSLGLLLIGPVLEDLGDKLTETPQPATPPAILEPSSPDARPSMDTSQTTDVHQSHNEDFLAVPQRSQARAGASQQFLFSQGLAQHSRSPSPQSQDWNNGMFNKASNFSLSSSVFIDNNTDNANIHINSSDEFLVKLLQETIIGAEFDSSARDPPPRCHPGTRLTILARCVAFIVNCNGQKKVRWVVGAVGVGKSAIMQSVAERNLSSVSLRASIFFCVNGRSGGSKAIVTLAYQLAVKCEPYRQFIKQEIAHDPSILQKSMSVQFNKFIVEPFIHHPQLNSVGRVLIIIDGLDECNKTHIQRELLRLISNLCLTHPSSPVVWMIASRPEHHITAFFAQASVEAAYEKEEIVVDSDEAREDVERHLCAELKAIQDEFSLQPHAQWPSDDDFWKLADASGGLFAYAQTVLKYIGNSDIGDPTGQLKDVLHVIDTHPLSDVPWEEHPMAHLDALYARILFKVPARVRQTVRKLLLALVHSLLWNLDREGRNFVVLCNWLGISSDEAYAALRHLSSVLYIPCHGKAHMEQLRCFHKSFLDYISDFTRSGFFPSGKDDMMRDARQLHYQCVLRVLEQAPDGIDVGDLDYSITDISVTGTLARGPGTGDNNSLHTWPVHERNGWDDNKTKLYTYKLAFKRLMEGVRSQEPGYNSVFFIRLLATRFESFTRIDAQDLFGSAFSQFRDEFMEQGLLQRIPIKVLSTWSVVSHVYLRFRRPITPNTNLSDPWNASCDFHVRIGEWGRGKDQNWRTSFDGDPRGFLLCDFCHRRFKNQLESRKARLPDYQVTVLFTSAGIGGVEFQFIDPEDGISEWTYLFSHKFDKEERMKLGSPV